MRARRILSLWFPRLASDRWLRRLTCPGPFAVVARAGRGDHLHCLTAAAEAAGLSRGMALADARAVCPALVTRPADLAGEAAFLARLARWAGRWSPLVGREGADGLVLDVSGVAHLFGGEAGLMAEVAAAGERAGLTLRAGLGDTRGAAWALARFAPGRVAAPGAPLAALGGLPPAALRLDSDTAAALARLGLRRIADLAGVPRATLARRFGAALPARLDQALGAAPEPVAPERLPPHIGVRLTLPEPVGLLADLEAGLARLLPRLCAQLAAAGLGARRVRLDLRRVDGAGVAAEIGLARPMREADAIARLFRPSLEAVDAGFGIDALRLTAPVTEAMPARQIAAAGATEGDRLADLLTRLGNRLGFEAVTRVAPAESHIPERAFQVLAAAWADPGAPWPAGPPRPLVLFPPEPVEAEGAPPRRFRWRGQVHAVAAAAGPERIAPEWWFDDPGWRTGLRDYWRVETAAGQRLWLFHTPQMQGWAVQGAFA
jgi:protein ImuB